MSGRRILLSAGLFALVSAGAAFAAEEEDRRIAKALQDNSFLIEEAYNQEPGVVQHILNIRKQGRDWDLVFTQEWPLWSMEHQFSYSIPFTRLRSSGQRASGIGDVYLNYRYQFWTETMTRPAFAPRFSFIVPSGDETRGLGDGSNGMQINLPFSKIVSDRVTLHANAGYTRMFDIEGLKTNSYTLGGSVVYAASRTLNFMLEGLHDWSEAVDTGEIVRERAFTLSPGIRYAFNLDAGQLVVGAGAPMVFVSGQRTSYGAIIYLSFEHSFLNKKK
jgi:hypothetical protein